MPVLVSVLQMLTLVVGKVEPPYRRPAHVSWSARGQAGSQKRSVPTLHLLYFSMIGQRWRSVYYYFPAQLYGIETAKCKKTAIVVQLHQIHQKQTVARVIKLATSEKVNKEGGADMETSGLRSSSYYCSGSIW
jgi:hypothetical protein